MFNINSSAIFYLILILNLGFCITEENVETNWFTCEKDLKTPIVSSDIKVYVPQCPPVNGTETRCQMVKGFDAVLKIQFKPNENVEGIERVIVARVPVSGKYVEMPYGPSMNPCENSSTIADDGSECVDNSVVANKLYTFTSLFKVLNSFPSVENITTRVIIRKKLEDHKKIRLYRKHPGPVLACITIPNIDVVEPSESATAASTTAATSSSS